jgi:hypothetical protein
MFFLMVVGEELLLVFLMVFFLGVKHFFYLLSKILLTIAGVLENYDRDK